MSKMKGATMSVLLIGAWTIAVCVVAVVITACHCVWVAATKANAIEYRSTAEAARFKLVKPEEIGVLAYSKPLSTDEAERIRKQWFDWYSGPIKQ